MPRLYLSLAVEGKLGREQKYLFLSVEGRSSVESHSHSRALDRNNILLLLLCQIVIQD
jgi:hypothetical protein